MHGIFFFCGDGWEWGRNCVAEQLRSIQQSRCRVLSRKHTQCCRLPFASLPPQRRVCLPAFVCLFVCLLATSRKNWWSNLRENLPETYVWTRKAPLNFCESSGSGSRNFNWIFTIIWPSHTPRGLVCFIRRLFNGHACIHGRRVCSNYISHTSALNSSFEYHNPNLSLNLTRTVIHKNLTTEIYPHFNSDWPPCAQLMPWPYGRRVGKHSVV